MVVCARACRATAPAALPGDRGGSAQTWACRVFAGQCCRGSTSARTGAQNRGTVSGAVRFLTHGQFDRGGHFAWYDGEYAESRKLYRHALTAVRACADAGHTDLSADLEATLTFNDAAVAQEAAYCRGLTALRARSPSGRRALAAITRSSPKGWIRWPRWPPRRELARPH